MALDPWYKVVLPRADLREGRPLDAAEFAVRLDDVRLGRAPAVYVDPAQFFERTYPTRNLRRLAVEVLRRLAGETLGASGVYNLTTQFGGGKTHALTLLYHLACGGERAREWPGVPALLADAGVAAPQAAAVAVFVGQTFDAVGGRKEDGPTRRTPWGEMAFQLGGERAFARVADHDRFGVAPDAMTLASIFPPDQPALILMDEVMNYVARARTVPAGENRASNGATQFYVFLQNLIEAVQSRRNVALLVALQASELEMTAEDESDYARLQKLLDRVARAELLSEGTEIAEIVRRRLFEWTGLPRPAPRVASAYAAWVTAHRQLLPGWFPVDQAEAQFLAAYPFHPTVLSVFERKWQTLPRFQRTRGILHLLALWVVDAYEQGLRGAHRDPLITLGTAPLENGRFRAALFEQLGEQRLEPAVTTDIAGNRGAHAIRLDETAPRSFQRLGLHRKVATAIFFESNGGQARAEATLPELRLAVGEPDLDIGSVEQALSALEESCYYLHVAGGRYRFGVRPNLNHLLADRRATIADAEVATAVWNAVTEVFQSAKGVGEADLRVVLGPEHTRDVPDEPRLTLVVLRPDRSMANEAATRAFIEQCVREHGQTGRTFKNALVFAVAADGTDLEDRARRFLAWKGLQEDEARLGLDDEQRRLLSEHVRTSQRDLAEAVWRAYRHLVLLRKDGSLKSVDLGLVHSSAAPSLQSLIIEELQHSGDVATALAPSRLVANWPPARTAWPTKAVHDAIFAAPVFPRLLRRTAIQDTIAEGVAQGLFAYGLVGLPDETLRLGTALSAKDVDISEEAYLLAAEEARRRLERARRVEETPTGGGSGERERQGEDLHHTGAGAGQEKDEDQDAERGGEDIPAGDDAPGRVTRVTWSGNIPHQKWVLFYRRVLMPLVSSPALAIQVHLAASDPSGFDGATLAELRTALRDLTGDDTLVESSESEASAEADA
ncbi:MAG: DUF499 domain-containing protein [Actinomycetia bacterium]|nr:DUF499 domain-containing protein [Actinomycetes bacterium]